MPRNITGGSGHKSQKNSESSKSRHNKDFNDKIMDDFRDGMNTEDIFIGRVLQHVGHGQMKVFYTKKEWSEEEEKEIKREITQIVPMRGGLRGKGKKDVHIGVGDVVMIAETGLSNVTHEIISVFYEPQRSQLRKLRPDLDPRIFVADATANEEDSGGGVVFEEEEEEMNIEDI
jgi:hypothetical protein